MSDQFDHWNLACRLMTEEQRRTAFAAIVRDQQAQLFLKQEMDREIALVRKKYQELDAKRWIEWLVKKQSLINETKGTEKWAEEQRKQKSKAVEEKFVKHTVENVIWFWFLFLLFLRCICIDT